jgi:phosphoglycolate phosphatase-like HAD superfamily hydrolase
MSGDGAPDIRLLLADVDGTLVAKEKLLTDRAVEAVRKGFARATARRVVRTPSNASLQSVERC